MYSPFGEFYLEHERCRLRMNLGRAHANLWGFSFFDNWVAGPDQTDVVNVLDSD